MMVYFNGFWKQTLSGRADTIKPKPLCERCGHKESNHGSYCSECKFYAGGNTAKNRKASHAFKAPKG